MSAFSSAGSAKNNDADYGSTILRLHYDRFAFSDVPILIDFEEEESKKLATTLKAAGAPFVVKVRAF
jgi:hypothetical protein